MSVQAVPPVGVKSPRTNARARMTVVAACNRSSPRRSADPPPAPTDAQAVSRCPTLPCRRVSGRCKGAALPSSRNSRQLVGTSRSRAGSGNCKLAGVGGGRYRRCSAELAATLDHTPSAPFPRCGSAPGGSFTCHLWAPAPVRAVQVSTPV
ncbi:MAG: hypothetical protein JWN34_950 [Bryobacterales bacterium]|nr:hypothetical protein [Bryobacterales bacterium]